MKSSKMNELWIFVAFIIAWFALQAWILPKFGIST
jgi:hypothetical protein